MITPKHNIITGIIAPKGRGKTYEITRQITQEPKVVIFDTASEDSYSIACDEIVFGNPSQLGQYIGNDYFRVAYRTVNLEEGFNHCARLVYLRGSCLFVIEETDQICSPQSMPEMMKTLINIGRHRELSVIFVSRRFATVNRLLTANANRYIFFRINEPIDLDGIAERCGVEVAEAVAGLRPLQLNPVIIPGQLLRWEETGEWSIEDETQTVPSGDHRPVPARKPSANDNGIPLSPQPNPGGTQQNGGENQTSG